MFIDMFISSLLIGCIRVYQTLLSPEKSVWVKWGIVRERKTCVFYPTCSEYMILAIKKYGAWKGVKKVCGYAVKIKTVSMTVLLLRRKSQLNTQKDKY
jgi:putative component of membrane protein insertase Oxa1/YidC/SpoIIIJ protein YidD